jgi:UDP-N-acetylmuramate dehydrogenase
MMNEPVPHLPPAALDALRAQFGPALQENVSMASYTTARVGGRASALLVANSAADLELFATHLWALEVPFYVLGSGSNVLISDQGLEGVVVLNKARAIKIEGNLPAGLPPEQGSEQPWQPGVWAESGANFGTIARQVALRGLSGLEWAATIPGTLGGAVYGNAGAYGSDMSKNLLLANILHRGGKESLTLEQMGYSYRSSALKRAKSSPGMPGTIILSAQLKLEISEPQTVQAKMEANASHRRRTQPPGASMGSMFKNPPGDYAGRLIEAAGLKGTRVGDAEISPVHANFFINHGAATASDIGQLIGRAQAMVAAQFGIELELEVELLGNWPEYQKSVEEAA